MTKKTPITLEGLTQTQKERLFYIEVKAFFCGDLTRADLERRFGVKAAASGRDLSTYQRLAPANLFYNAAQRNYATTEKFSPLFEHSAERVLTWFRSGFGDSLNHGLKRTVPCDGAGHLVKPDIPILANLTRAIAARRQVKVGYQSLSSGSSDKTLCPLALFDTGLRWYLRAYDNERKRFADFALTRIVKAENLEARIPFEQQIESDLQWARIVHLELAPHPGIAYPKAIEADFRMINGLLALDMRSPLVGYALRRWSVDCSPEHSLDPKEHHLWLKNPETLSGVESAALAPGYTTLDTTNEPL